MFDLIDAFFALPFHLRLSLSFLFLAILFCVLTRRDP